MENLLFSFNTVFPLFALIIIGMILKKINILDDHYVVVANRLVYKLTLPAMVFNNIYSNRNDASSAIPALIYIFVMLTVVYLVNTYFVLRRAPLNKKGVLIQNSIHSNSILLGLPLVTNMFGNEGAAMMSMLLPATTPYYNSMAVISHALASVNQKASVKNILKGLASNLIIHAALLGVVFNWLNLYLPKPIETVVTDLSRMATPLALIALGASFKVASLHSNAKYLFLGSLVRLIIVPIILVSFAVLLGFRGIELAVMMVFFAGPIAVSSFSQTQEGGGDTQFTAQLIVITTLLSAITLFSFIFVLRSFNLI